MRNHNNFTTMTGCNEEPNLTYNKIVYFLANPQDHQPVWIIAADKFDAQELYNEFLAGCIIPSAMTYKEGVIKRECDQVKVTALKEPTHSIDNALFFAFTPASEKPTVITHVTLQDYVTIKEALTSYYQELVDAGVCIVNFDTAFAAALGKYFVSNDSHALQFIADENLYIIYDVR